MKIFFLYPSLSLIIGLLIMYSPVFAKRNTPPPLAPLVIHGVTYSLETYESRHWIFWKHWNCELVASKNGKRLWSKIVYSYKLDMSKEQDVQQIYPKTLSISMSKIPDANGTYHVKGINVFDETDMYHYIEVTK